MSRILEESSGGLFRSQRTAPSGLVSLSGGAKGLGGQGLVQGSTSVTGSIVDPAIGQTSQRRLAMAQSGGYEFLQALYRVALWNLGTYSPLT